MHDPIAPEADEVPQDTGDLTAPGFRVVDPEMAGPVTSDGRWFSPFRIGLVVIVVVAALVSWDLTRSSSPTYRTSVVATGTVVATLDSVGTITPVNQAALNFNASGTVAAVDVSVGQAVTAGQTLASLDLASLNASVISAQAAVASAKATLANAEASETDATTSSGSSTATATAVTTATTTAATTATTATSSLGAGPSTSSTAVAQLQATLVADQTQLDSDSALAGVSLQQATAQCATSSSSSSPSSTTSTTAPTSGSSSGGGTAGACTSSLSQASSAQTAVAADIKQVGADERALTSALESSSSTANGTSSATKAGGTSSGSTAGSTGSTNSSSGSGATASGTTPGGGGQSTKKATPQQVAVDQASVDTAAANLTDAQQAVAGADLVSTIAGTVASISIAAGDSVTAGSDSSPAQVVVIGSGSSYQVTTDIPVADIAKVAVGQEALVTPDSTNAVQKGAVSAIGVVASSGTTSTTYPVTISLDSSDLGQLSGVDGDVELITTRSVGVTTVPSSAVRTVGTIHLVTVVKDGTPTPVRVTLGTVGDVLTQVKSGVAKGQVISLADVSQPLPSTSSSTTRSAFGGAGSFGGGLGGAGFGGGSFRGGTGGASGGGVGG